MLLILVASRHTLCSCTARTATICSLEPASRSAADSGPAMGSKRTPDDPAADVAAADGDARQAAACTAATVEQQQSSSQQQQDFVNEGLQTFLERRRQWTQKPADFKRSARKRAHSPSVTPDQVMSMTPFPKPVALHEVVEVLLDVWEDEDYL